MTELKQMNNQERKVFWANKFIKRLEELTKNEGTKVKFITYFKDGSRPRREYTLLKDNVKSIVDYISYLKTNDLIKPLSAGVEASRFVYFAKDIKKPFKEVTRHDIEEFLKNMEGKSEAYRMGFKIILKAFFRWFYGYKKGKGYPDVVDWIEYGKIKNEKFPDILTMEEIQKMLEVCDNLRDRALISLLYESGCRASEILGLRVNNVTFDEYGAIIIVDGKTGSRRIRLISSVPDLKAWLNTHPKKNEVNASLSLFYSFARNCKFNPLGCNTLDFIVSDVAKRAGITKRIYPHLFRHTRATHLAKSLTEQELKVYFGWTRTSNMAGIYVHLSGKDIDDKILQINGIKQKDGTDVPKIPIIKCWSCGTINSIGNRFCSKCDSPITEKDITELQRMNELKSAMLPRLIQLYKDGEIDKEKFIETIELLEEKSKINKNSDKTEKIKEGD